MTLAGKAARRMNMADPILILIVDDNKPSLEAVKEIFKMQGYEVETADCGEIAIEMIASKKYAAVILDIMLPRVDGFEVCRRVRADAKNSKTPVILITALDIPEISKMSAEVRANDFIFKPFKAEDLVAKVKKYIPNT